MALGAVSLGRFHFIAAAIAISMSGCAVSAERVPAGWDRDDYIGYLVLFDFLRGASAEGEPFVVCLVDGMNSKPAFYDQLPDANSRLIDALAADFAARVTVRPGSTCRNGPHGVEESATGRGAMYVSTDLVESDERACGTHIVSWWHAVLWGGGTFYAVDLRKDPPAVNESEICFTAT
jgi:hypothetical protein